MGPLRLLIRLLIRLLRPAGGRAHAGGSHWPLVPGIGLLRPLRAGGAGIGLLAPGAPGPSALAPSPPDAFNRASLLDFFDRSFVLYGPSWSDAALAAGPRKPAGGRAG